MNTPQTGTVLGATASNSFTNCLGTEDDDVWYSFVATSTTASIFLTGISGSTTDLVHGVLSGSCGALAQVFCSDPNTSSITGLTVGQTYYIQVFTFIATPNQNTNFTITVVPRVTNDECSNAINLTVNTPQSASTSGATASGVFTACPGTENDDVWFSFVAASPVASIDLTSVSGTVTDMVHSILGGSCGTLTQLNCSDPNSSTTAGLTVGQTYYVQVHTFSGTSQTTAFNIIYSSTPANDNCSGAIAIGEGVVSGVTFAATNEAGIPANCPGTSSTGTSTTITPGNKGIWYAYTPSNSGTATFTTCSSNTSFDTKLHIYTGSCTALVCAGSNDDAGTALCPINSVSSTVSIPVTCGTVYYILVGGFLSTTGGIFELSTSLAPTNICTDATVYLDAEGIGTLDSADLTMGYTFAPGDRA
ncbi:MAG: hypothetical protein HC821_01830, partial [Lewinella sp.]|nr:hypothetical protein [Lewinella sp.]